MTTFETANIVNVCTRAVQKFDTHADGELAFKVGDILLVTGVVDKIWYEGVRLRDQARGRFPSAYVIPLEELSYDGPDTQYFYAVETFVQQHPEDLRFRKGDFILGKRQIDQNWWEGSVEGRTGIFPLSFVYELPKPSRVVPSSQRARVKTPLKAQLPDEIDLNEGEDVFILEFTDKSWCRGRTADGREGLIPVGFVTLVEDSELSSEQHSMHASENFVNDGIHADPNEESHDAPYSYENIRPYGRTKAAFFAQRSGELSFMEGEIVYLLGRVDGNWMEGEIAGKIGMVPSDFIDVIVDMDESDVGTEFSSAINQGNSSFAQTSVGSPYSAAIAVRQMPSQSNVASTLSAGDWKRVVYDFPGAEQGDLPAAEGDIVEVLGQVDANWIQCCNRTNGLRGIIPVGFLEDIPQSDHAAMYTSATPIDLYDSQAVKLRQSSFSDRFTESEVSASKPPRPRPPQMTSLSNAPARLHESFETAAHAALPCESAAVSVRDDSMRQKVIADLIQSERDYCRDLMVIADIFTRASEANYSQAKGISLSELVMDFPGIIELSQQMLSSFERETTKQTENQEFGSCFLRFADKLKDIYCEFCDHLERAGILLEKFASDAALSKILIDCLADVQRSTTCLDLNAALSRPIQRMLKYPLFIGELLKNTQTNAADHVKLQQALRSMTDAAHHLNEAKRKKDIVIKYREQADGGVVDRLSKLSLHSVRKKSSRVSMRISSTLGLGHITKDERFEALERDFRQQLRALQQFLKNVEAVFEQLQTSLSQMETVCDTLLDVYGTQGKIAVVRQLHSIWNTITTHHMDDFFTTVNSRVRRPALQLQQLCSGLFVLKNPLAGSADMLALGPEKLIAKRMDKLLDYDAATLQAEQRNAQLEYEALNSQLVAELPKLLECSSNLMKAFVGAFVAALDHFFVQIRHALEALEPHVSMPLSTVRLPTLMSAGFREQFALRQAQILDSIAAKVSFCTGSDGKHHHEAAAGESGSSAASSFASGRFGSFSRSHSKTSSPPASRRSDALADLSAPSVEIPSTPRNRVPVVFPQKPQSDANRIALRQKYPATRLFVARQATQPQGDLELSLNQNDLVGVVVNKDPMGNTNRWFADNGAEQNTLLVSKGFVASDLLTPFVGEPAGLPLSTGGLSRSSGTTGSYARGEQAEGDQHVAVGGSARFSILGSNESVGSEPVLIDLSDPQPKVTPLRPDGESHVKDLSDLSWSLSYLHSPASHYATSVEVSRSTARPHLAYRQPLNQSSISPPFRPQTPPGFAQQTPPSFREQTPPRFRSQTPPNFRQQTPPRPTSNPLDNLDVFGSNFSQVSQSVALLSRQPQTSPTSKISSAEATQLPRPKDVSVSTLDTRGGPGAITHAHSSLSTGIETQQQSRSIAVTSSTDQRVSLPKPVATVLPSAASVSVKAANFDRLQSETTSQTSTRQTMPAHSLHSASSVLTRRADSISEIVPIRPAPSPPTSASAAPAARISRSQTVASAAHSPEQVEPFANEPQPAKQQPEFYISEYEFNASGQTELSLIEDQMVAVLLKHDLNGNPQWWFVENEFGDQGYVPAAYLRPLG